MPQALSLALVRAGSSIAARMAMMAMTTSNSIKVNAAGRGGPAPILFPLLCFIVFLSCPHSLANNARFRDQQHAKCPSLLKTLFADSWKGILYMTMWCAGLQ